MSDYYLSPSRKDRNPIKVVIHYNHKGKLLCATNVIMPQYTTEEELVTCNRCTKKLPKVWRERNEQTNR